MHHVSKVETLLSLLWPRSSPRVESSLCPRQDKWDSKAEHVTAIVHWSRGGPPAKLLECQCVPTIIGYHSSKWQRNTYDMRQIGIFYPQSLSPRLQIGPRRPRSGQVLGSVERLTVIPTLHTHQPLLLELQCQFHSSLEVPVPPHLSSTWEHLILQKSVCNCGGKQDSSLSSGRS